VTTGASRANNGPMEDLRTGLETWLHRLPAYVDAKVTGLAPVDGGVSNLTYRATLQDAPLAAVALRMQRKEGIFQPYNVIREAEVLARLATSPIPVPHVLGGEWDPEILGARFIVLEWIDAPHMGEAGPDADFGAFTRMVAAIHQLDWQALRFEFLGVPTSPENAVLGEVAAVARRMKAFGCDTDPLLRTALSTLQARRPTEGRLALCQGDINVFNYLFRSGEVVGVVDWEQARISDPRSDVGQLLALSNLKGAPFGPVEDMPFLQAYQSASGQQLSEMAYFRAFWFFQLTVIYHGFVRLNGTEPWFTLPDLTTMLEHSLTEIT
jgi:aminoglycoside phosphotransferase (APT) family kinase protein